MNLKTAFHHRGRRGHGVNGVSSDGRLVVQLAKTIRWQVVLRYPLGECACYANHLSSFASSAPSAVQKIFPG
jgi:hypothetical protein